MYWCGYRHGAQWYDIMNVWHTSSSAVAKRPHDASCLSVVSINSTKRPTESFIVSYLSLRAFKCCSVVFGVTLKLHVINILPSFPAINKHRRLLPAKSHNLRDVVRRRRIYNTWPLAALTAVKPHIGSESRFMPIPPVHSTPPLGGGGSRGNIVMPFDTKKLE